MTDEEYKRLLEALASKHLRPPAGKSRRGSATFDERGPEFLSEVSALARLVNAAASDPKLDKDLLQVLSRRIAQEHPIEKARDAMDEVGMLDALDDAPLLVFGEFRRSAIPDEDVEMLRRAGFTDAEIEVFLALAVEYAHRLAGNFYPYPPPEPYPWRRASAVLEDAARTLHKVATKLSAPPGAS